MAEWSHLIKILGVAKPSNIINCFFRFDIEMMRKKTVIKNRYQIINF